MNPVEKWLVGVAVRFLYRRRVSIVYGEPPKPVMEWTEAELQEWLEAHPAP